MNTEYHFIITLGFEAVGSYQACVSGTCTVAPGASRNDVYTKIMADAEQAARRNASPGLALGRSWVLFFSLEPNKL